MKQNAEYRSRLARIHADSAVADLKGGSSPFHIAGSGAFVASGPPSERVCDHVLIYFVRNPAEFYFTILIALFPCFCVGNSVNFATGKKVADVCCSGHFLYYS